MPGRTIILYDDQCVVCQAGVAWVRFFDRRGATDCWPVQGTDVAALHPALDEQELCEFHATGWSLLAGVRAASDSKGRFARERLAGSVS